MQVLNKAVSKSLHNSYEKKKDDAESLHPMSINHPSTTNSSNARDFGNKVYFYMNQGSFVTGVLI